MDVDKIIAQAKRIKNNKAPGFIVEAKEFLRVYAGENSSFFTNMVRIINESQRVDFEYYEIPCNATIKTLEAFISYVENGLFEGVSIERKAQIDVVSDFLEQAHTFLNDKRVHPAAPAVIIGAALEEFLRNWIEDSNLDLGAKKPGLDSYSKVLREEKLITKQDVKDITSWAGLRNHAAHGEWDEVDDKKRISIMSEAVDLFMRKYGEHKT